MSASHRNGLFTLQWNSSFQINLKHHMWSNKRYKYVIEHVLFMFMFYDTQIMTIPCVPLQEDSVYIYAKYMDQF